MSAKSNPLYLKAGYFLLPSEATRPFLITEVKAKPAQLGTSIKRPFLADQVILCRRWVRVRAQSARDFSYETHQEGQRNIIGTEHSIELELPRSSFPRAEILACTSFRASRQEPGIW